MENAISTLSVMPDNKASLKTFSESYINAALNGYNDMLQIAKQIKIFEEFIKQVKEGLKEAIQDESDNFNEKTIEKYNCTFQKRELPRYDFSGCNDSELELRYKALELAKEAVKERETMLKTLKTDIVSMETGEIIHPPTKTITSSLAITLK